MLNFLSTYWIWILLIGGMLLMHRSHGGHGGHGGGGYGGGGCGGGGGGGGHASHAGDKQSAIDLTKHEHR